VKDDSDSNPTETALAAEVERLRSENDRHTRRIEQLERRISLQPQSGLPTHFRLEVELEGIIEGLKTTEDKRGLSLLILQLGESYAALRKTLKTSISEWILYQTGSRISSLLRAEDRLFHTRESEFVLVLPGLKGEGLAKFLRSLIPRLAEPHIFSGLNITIGASIGGAYWPEHGCERSPLMHHADIAAGASAERKRSFTLFKPELLSRAVERVELQNAIIKAIEQNGADRIGEQFYLLFQPKLFLGALEGDLLRIESIEAEILIRWRHPDKGVLSPTTFIPLAEETGLILPLGKWLIYQSARKLAAIMREVPVCSGLSINLSARQFHSDDAAEIVATALARSGARPADLTIEVTETGLFEDPETAAKILRKFNELGVKISMDDFGTGYSSLSHLHRFPLHEIKIDRQFIEDLSDNRQDQIIVRSLIAISRGMGLSLVAEGVEKPEAVRMLWDMGCTGFQGFLFAKPLSEDDFVAFCARIRAQGMTWKLGDRFESLEPSE
jgi:EAL domain-containing protein (putative c-di-GMP-specific phosphodiesterase class I)/GGDEF domain-containing protein